MITPTETLTILQTAANLSDPHICSDFRDRRSILAALFDALVRRNAVGAYVPALAARWEVSADARVWTFDLRDDVRFHDGTRLCAADAVASLERVCDPALGGELGTQGVYLSYLAGAHFHAVHDQTLRITLAEPLADLLDLLVDMPIAPRTALARLPGTPIGSGPYRLTYAGPGRLEMEAWDGYHGTPPPAARLVWLAEPDDARRAERLVDREVDLVSVLKPEYRALVHFGGAYVQSGPNSMCVIVMLNCADGPCTDPRVRRALNYALDVPAIIEDVLLGDARPLNGPLTPLHLACDSLLPPYAFNPGMARALLREAGYAESLHLVLHTPTIHPDEALSLAEHVSFAWAAIGIETQVITHMDRPAYADMVRSKQIGDACLFDSSPLSSLRVLREKIHAGLRGPWWEGYDNPAVDALIDAASAEPDTARRQAIYHQAYRRIRDDAPWVFLYSPDLLWGVGPSAQGWQPGMDGVIRIGN